MVCPKAALFSVLFARRPTVRMQPLHPFISEACTQTEPPSARPGVVPGTAGGAGEQLEPAVLPLPRGPQR